MQDTIILYDIENGPLEMLAYAIERARERGAVSIRVLSDWTVCHQQQKWQDFFRSQDAEFIQIGRASTGKNALDYALFEAALAIADKESKCFIAVTSDSDFAKLAQDLHRSADTCVIGVGRNGDETLKAAYDEFFQYDPGLEPVEKTVRTAIPVDASVSDRLRGVLRQMTGYANDWAPLGEVGNVLKQRYPKFKTPAQYPKKLKTVFALHHAQFEMKEEGGIYYVREKIDARPVSHDTKAKEKAEGYPEIEMRLRWKIALLMANEGIDRAAIERVVELPGEEIDGLERLAKKIKG